MSTTPGPLDGYTVAAPNCPPWCTRQHPVILSDYPTAATDVAPWVTHETPLATCGPVVVTFAQVEDLPDEPTTEPTCCLSINDDTGQPAAAVRATVADLRAWARLLTTAADLAQRMESRS